MRHSKPAQLETAPTKHGGESVYLFFEFTLVHWLIGLLNIILHCAPPR